MGKAHCPRIVNAGLGLCRCPMGQLRLGRAPRRHRRPGRRDSRARLAACAQALDPRRRTAERRDRRPAANDAGRDRRAAVRASRLARAAAREAAEGRSTSDCSATTSCGSAGSRCRLPALPALDAWYREQARAELDTRRRRTRRARLGVTYTRLTIRDQHTRWGSCSKGGALSFNWRLILAPPADPQLRRRPRALPSHPPRPLRRASGTLVATRAPDVRGGARAGSPSTAPSSSRTACRSAASRSDYAARAVERWATFDCYGTLVDWNAGHPRPSSATSCCRATTSSSRRSRPRIRRVRTATSCARFLARLGLDDPDALARSLPAWPVFPEVRESLEDARRRGWKLAILSNTDRDFIEASMASIGVPFELAIVASEIGSYKPALGHWRAFEERVGRLPDVHVAASHFHDVVPAPTLGVPSDLDQPPRGVLRAAADPRAAGPRRAGRHAR